MSQKNNQKSKLETKNYILYLDTSEPDATIAIYNGNNLIKEEKWQGHRELADTLSGKYQEVLKNTELGQEDLKGICVFKGPGSFTGLRIGISFANGLAYGLKIPIYGTKKQNQIDLLEPEKIIVPEYGSEPKITKPATAKNYQCGLKKK